MNTNIEVQVLLLGSRGVWGVGKTLDEAFKKARMYGSLGKQVIIHAAPAAARMYVDESGGLRYYGNSPRDVLNADGERVWANRCTAAMRAAVDEAIASITADDVRAATDHAALADEYAAARRFGTPV